MPVGTTRGRAIPASGTAGSTRSRTQRTMVRMPTAAQRIVDQLVLLGADMAFGVPGESYLAVLDALVDTP